MSQQESISVLTSAAELINTSSSVQSLISGESENFADILKGVSAVGDVALNASSIGDVFSVDDMQEKILAEVGLDNPDILSLSMNTSMISELQQGLLSSLQTSMIKSSLNTVGNIAADGIQVSGDVTSGTVSSLTSSDDIEGSSLVDDIYSYSFGEDGFNQKDIIDSVNILNHTPILSYIYQETTNTEISPAATLAGSVLYSDYVGTGSTAIKLIMDYFTKNNSDGIAAGVSSFLSDDTNSESDIAETSGNS